MWLLGGMSYGFNRVSFVNLGKLMNFLVLICFKMRGNGKDFMLFLVI